MQSRFSHNGHKGINSVRAILAGLLALVAFAPAASAGDFVDTRLSFVFSDDNLLSGPGESLINSPEIDFGGRKGNYYPFENLNSQDNGDETLTHLVLYKEMPGFIKNLTTDAAFVARLAVLTEPENGFAAGDIKLKDDGSYIRARYSFTDVEIDAKTGHTKDSARQLTFLFYPTNADRFRAGFTYDLSWGGNKIFTQQKSQFATPGFKLRFDWDGFYLQAGAKSTRQLILTEDKNDVANRELGAFWGGLLGLGYVGNMWALEANAAIFDAGRNPKQGVQGKSVVSGGVSARLSAFSDGFKPESSIDYRLYRNNDDSFEASNYFLRKPKNYNSLTWRASIEGNWLTQVLGDSDKIGSTKRIDAFAGALRSDLYIGKFAINIDLVYRDLYFILFNVPGLDPYMTLPSGSSSIGEILFAVKGEYWFESTNLLPSLQFGIQKPASYRGRVSETLTPSALAGGMQTVAVMDSSTIIAFPAGNEPKEIYSIKLALRWDLSDMMSLIGTINYNYDRNQLGRRKDSVDYTAEYYMRDPHVFGLGIFAQARF
ncbi:MAG: hypothetical protein IJ165_02695 [Proteobacteria bacterium]|nr:hypothetical protein [Pseudomonadota bacterium]